jgi:hypothetical protein
MAQGMRRPSTQRRQAMGILSNIFHKVFPSSHPAVAQQTGAPGSMQSASGQAAQPAPQQGAPARPPPAAPMAQVDVEAILANMVVSSGQALNWRESIIDLLKLLHLDSSLDARKDLARELDYKGDMNDAASMNIWLHRQVMNRLAANGGKVPPDLRD